VFLEKKTKGTQEREKKQESEKKKYDTLNKKMVLRFLCREFCFDQEFVWEDFYISFGLSCFLKRHRANSTTTRAQQTLRIYYYYYLYTTIERERERRPVSIYIVSRVRLLFARVIYCGVVRASKIISLRSREKKEK